VKERKKSGNTENANIQKTASHKSKNMIAERAIKIIGCLRKRFPVGTRVKWGRRKKAPGITPDAMMIDFAWDASGKRDGGFTAIMEWELDGGHKQTGTQHDYAKFMFERYKQAIIEASDAPSPVLPKRFHVMSDVMLFDLRRNHWVFFGDVIPSFIRRKLQEPMTTAWIIAQEEAFESGKSPMLLQQPPTKSCGKYTFGKDSSPFNRINKILATPPPPAKRLRPLPAPTPPPSPMNLSKLCEPDDSVLDQFIADKLLSPISYDDELIDDMLLTPLPPLPIDFLNSLK